MSSDQQERRERAVRSVLKSVAKLNARDYDHYLDDFAEDFEFRADFLPRPLDREQSLQYMKEFVRIFPGVQLKVDEIFTDTDATSLVYRFTANADGTDGFMGLPPTRGPIEFRGATFYRFANGLRVESWNFWDNAGILQQMGDLSGIGPGDAGDATKSSGGAPAAGGLPAQELIPAALRDSSVYDGETLLLGYAVETATVHHGDAGIYLVSDAEAFNLDGRPVGRYRGALGVVAPLDPRALVEPPPMPAPVGPGGPSQFAEVPVIGHLFVEFRFDDQDSVTIVGSGTGNLTPLDGGASFFMISAMGRVAGGTGRYQDATGIANLSGITRFDGKLDFAPGTVFDFKTFFTLHLAHPAKPAAAASPPAAGPSRTGGRADGDAKAAVDELLRRTADFSLRALPDPARPNTAVTRHGGLLGVDVRTRLHRFALDVARPGRAPVLRSLLERGVGRLDMRWRPIPDGFVARPGEPVPPTAWQPGREQRFVVDDVRLELGGGGAGFRGFGTGRMLPPAVPGTAGMLMGAVIDVLGGFGDFSGLQGLLVVNGTFEPPHKLGFEVLLRLFDPGGELLASRPLQPLAPSADPDPGTVYLAVTGQPAASPPATGSGAPAEGLTRVLEMRRLSIGCEVGARGIRCRTEAGPAIGRMSAEGIFDPSRGRPPYPFRTRNGVFEFLDRDQRPIGTIHADMVEGRVFPTAAAASPAQIYRVGAFAPFARTEGCFRHATGLLSVNSVFTLTPDVLKDVFVFALRDPTGTCQAAIARSWLRAGS